MKLSDLRLGQRLALGFGAMLLISGLVAATGWSRLAASEQEFGAAAKAQAEAAKALSWEGLTRVNVTRALAQVKSGANKDVIAYFDPQMKATTDLITALQKDIEASATSPELQALLAEAAARRSAYIKTRKDALEGLRRGDSGAPAKVDAEVLPAADAYLDAILRLRQSLEAHAATLTAGTHSAVGQAQRLLLGFAALALLVGGAFGWLLTRSVTGPLRQAIVATQKIAAGDLSHHIVAQGRDEAADLLRAMTQMQQSLRKVIGELRDTTDSIRVSSSEIADGSLDLSTRTERSAANLQETSASLEQIKATVQHNADSALEVRELAGGASRVASAGGKLVEEVVGSMGQMAQRSARIADIVSVVEGIAFQTNILALNAAVEAARAGEQGRGFAVVASEVRSLAQRSSSAAREIKSLIDDSAAAVALGSQRAQQAGTSMAEIVAAILRLAERVNEISNSSRQQSDGVNQVSAAVGNLDEMTQQNAALVEQSAAAASSLRDQTVRLASLVAVFRLPQAV